MRLYRMRLAFLSCEPHLAIHDLSFSLLEVIVISRVRQIFFYLFLSKVHIKLKDFEPIFNA